MPGFEFRFPIGRTSNMTTPFEIELTSIVLDWGDCGNEYRFPSVEIGRGANELYLSSLLNGKRPRAYTYYSCRSDIGLGGT